MNLLKPDSGSFYMKRYFTIFTLLLITEVAIAIFHFHRFVRGFLGDVLVIPLLYSLLRGSTKLSVKKAAITVLFVAFTIEFLQYFTIAEILGIQSKILKTMLGTSFDPWDLLAYTLGFILILLFEKKHSLWKK